MASKVPLKLVSDKLVVASASDIINSGIFSSSCFVSGGSNQSLTSGSFTKITTGLSGTATGTGSANWNATTKRFTATRAGTHAAMASLFYYEFVSQEFIPRIRLFDSGGTELQYVWTQRGTSTNRSGRSIFVMVKMAVGDYLELWAYTTSSGITTDASLTSFRILS